MDLGKNQITLYPQRTDNIHSTSAINNIRTVMPNKRAANKVRFHMWLTKAEKARLTRNAKKEGLSIVEYIKKETGIKKDK